MQETIRTIISAATVAAITGGAGALYVLNATVSAQGAKIDSITPLLDEKTADRWTKTDEFASAKAQNLVDASLQDGIKRNSTDSARNTDAINQIWRELARLEAKMGTAP